MNKNALSSLSNTEPNTPSEAGAIIGAKVQHVPASKLPIHDPCAKLEYKFTKLSMNQYQHELFTKAAQKQGLTMLAFVRSTAIKEAEKILKDSD